MDTIKEQIKIAFIDRPANSTNFDFLPFLFFNLDDNSLLPK